MDTQSLREAGTAQRNATHASHGWPWMDTLGLREAGTAQRNAPPRRSSDTLKINTRGRRLRPGALSGCNFRLRGSE
jgi:hypothetical protein